MTCRPALLPLSLLLAFVAVAPARGEIYRWRDASGREHFTTDLGQVPARHREAAKTRQTQGGGYSKTSGPERSGMTGGAPFSPSDPAASPAVPVGESPDAKCRQAGKELRRQRKRVERAERKLEHMQARARKIGLGDTGRARAERRAEEQRERTEQLQRDYEARRDAYRREGLEPGCLR